MDSSDNKFMIILDKISEISERTARMEVQQESMRSDISEIKEEDRKQNDLLDEHIRGTVTNTERLNLEIETRKDLVDRVEKLEKVPQFLKSIYKLFGFVAVPIGVIYEVGRILKKW